MFVCVPTLTQGEKGMDEIDDDESGILKMTKFYERKCFKS